MGDLNRYYVDKVTDISPDQMTGIVKITFAVDGAKGGDVLQLIVSAGRLHEIFAQVGETMQKTFGSGPRPGAKGPRSAANMRFKDLTE